MKHIPYLGLAGVAGAGKDTVFERLQALGGPRFVRMSVADPLKESIAALFDIDLDTLDRLKRDPDSFVKVGGADPDRPGMAIYYGGGRQRRTMREFMQRYGTEAHRDVFGQDFWLDVWQMNATNAQLEAAGGAFVTADAPLTIVNTSVRFENEAQRIIEMGGRVFHVEGPQDVGAGGHPSEKLLPEELITGFFDNTVRSVIERAVEGRLEYETDYSHLDDQIATLLHGGART